MSVKNLIKEKAKNSDNKKMSFNVNLNEYNKLVSLLSEYNKKYLDRKKITITSILNANILDNIKMLEKELNKGV